VISFMPLGDNGYACWLIKFAKQSNLFFNIIAY